MCVACKCVCVLFCGLCVVVTVCVCLIVSGWICFVSLCVLRFGVFDVGFVLCLIHVL